MNSALQQIKWEDLPLSRELDETYRYSITRVINRVHPLLKTRPLGAEEFTDHDIQHSMRVIERIGKILPKSAKLNQPELCILHLAALLHDSAMWVPRSDAEKITQESDFIEWCERSQKEEWLQVKQSLNDEKRRWMGELGCQRLVAMYARTKHPQMFKDRLLYGDTENDVVLRTLIDPPFVESVGLISEAHGWERERVLNDKDLEPVEVMGELVNLRYLAELLRLGDLLDLGEGRISTLLWDYLRPLDAVSEAHWRKEHCLKLLRCEPDLIRIGGEFDIDAGGSITADAYVFAKDWIHWIQSEIDGCALLLSSRTEEKLRKRCHFGDLELKDETSAKGLVFGDNISFEMDKVRIIQLLGEEIYSEGCIFVRELMQNAIDATRAQMIREHRERAQKEGLNIEHPWDWPREITEQYPIESNIYEEQINGIRYLVFSVKDYGTGMTHQQLKEYFLQIGKSYYTSTTYKQEFKHSSISQFGIGFLSCITIADRIEVITRAHGEQGKSHGLKLRINSPSTYFTVERDKTCDFGTSVKLWINLDKEHPGWWHKLPFEGIIGGITSKPRDDVNILEILPLFAGYPKNEAVTPGTIIERFEAAVKQWCSLIEFPICVNKKNWKPRNISTIEIDPNFLHLRYKTYKDIWPHVSVPISLYSRKCGLIAKGKVTLFSWYKNSNIPIFLGWSPPINLFLYLTGINLKNEFANLNENYLININFLKKATKRLAANRSSHFFYSKIILRDIDNLFNIMSVHLFDELYRFSPVASFLWQRFLANTSFHLGIYQKIYPCKIKRVLHWFTKDEILAMFDRVLIAPFQIVLNSKYIHDIPVVWLNVYDHYNELNDCPIVEIENNCSALLYPNDASLEGLKLVNANATFTPLGLQKWDEGELNRNFDRRRLHDVNVIQDKTNLPIYDQDGNPWEKYGLDIDGIWLGKPRDKFHEKMESILMSIPNIEIPESITKIYLEDNGIEWM